ncbi:MAG: TetR/AcrR family transcriptional regulator [Bacteroidota bacterium]|nr:TetR/AcrR family transcriptional regulator [Bacteroidota bacterium]
MPVKDCQTEKLILDTAMRIFFTEGRMHATTQEIADEAGVNRTLIHYYFRSKKVLLDTLLKNARIEFSGNSDRILLSNLPFREKTEKFIGDFLNRLMKYPYLEPFITMNIIQERFKNKKLPIPAEPPAAIKHYINEIDTEMKAGNIPGKDPAQFALNLFSLIVYPLLTKQIQIRLLDLDDKAYQKILNERKKIIMDTLLPVNTNK